MEKEIVLITGANGNIAKRIVKKYLEHGSTVIATDIHEKSPIKEFENNDRYEYHKLDVTKIDEIAELYKVVEKDHGKLTHIISAAGRPSKSEIEGGLEGVTIEDIDESIRT